MLWPSSRARTQTVWRSPSTPVEGLDVRHASCTVGTTIFACRTWQKCFSQRTGLLECEQTLPSNVPDDAPAAAGLESYSAVVEQLSQYATSQTNANLLNNEATRYLTGQLDQGFALVRVLACCDGRGAPVVPVPLSIAVRICSLLRVCMASL